MRRMICSVVVLGVMLLEMSGESLADAAINATNFPDANFRTYISNNFDEDSNGVLNEEEIFLRVVWRLIISMAPSRV